MARSVLVRPARAALVAEIDMAPKIERAASHLWMSSCVVLPENSIQWVERSVCIGWASCRVVLAQLSGRMTLAVEQRRRGP